MRKVRVTKHILRKGLYSDQTLTGEFRCGYSGVAWVAVRPIKSNQWDAWVAVFFLKSVLFWANFRVKTRKNELI